jgi:hypothetical protein
VRILIELSEPKVEPEGEKDKPSEHHVKLANFLDKHKPEMLQLDGQFVKDSPSSGLAGADLTHKYGELGWDSMTVRNLIHRGTQGSADKHIRNLTGGKYKIEESSYGGQPTIVKVGGKYDDKKEETPQPVSDTKTNTKRKKPDTTSTPQQLLAKYKIDDRGGHYTEGKRSQTWRQNAQPLTNNGKLINLLRNIPVMESLGYTVKVVSSNYNSKPEQHEIQSEREYSFGAGTNVEVSITKDEKTIYVSSSHHYEDRDTEPSERGKGFIRVSTSKLPEELKELIKE